MSINFRKSARVFYLTILLGLSAAGRADARQAPIETERLAVMNREMDCIERHLGGGGEMSWRDSCSSQDAPAGYDMAMADRADGYGTAVNRDDDSRFAAAYAGDYSGPVDLSYAPEPPEGDARPDRFLKADLTLLAGYRKDDFDFNIASDMTGTATPNIISELTWSDLKMTQLKAEARIAVKNLFVLDGMVGYADIYDGDNQDSDYLGNNRTFEFSRSNNRSDDGEAMEWSGGAGYRFHLGPEPGFLEADDIWLTVLGGYSYHDLSLIMTDGFQTIPASGAFPGLHSSFWADWRGPWAGVELTGSRNRIFGLFRFEYHWADYYASANWNLRSDFEHPTSYEQWADGRGLVFNLGGGYKLSDNWDLNLRFDIRDWETDHGVIRFFSSDGTRSQQRLNEANWESKAVMLSGTCRF